LAREFLDGDAVPADGVQAQAEHAGDLATRSAMEIDELGDRASGRGEGLDVTHHEDEGGIEDALGEDSDASTDAARGTVLQTGQIAGADASLEVGVQERTIAGEEEFCPDQDKFDESGIRSFPEVNGGCRHFSSFLPIWNRRSLDIERDCG